MKHNIHVGPACDTIRAQLRARVRALNEQSDLFERIGRRRFTEADDIQLAAWLSPIIDTVTTATAAETKRLEHVKGIERDSKTSPLAQRG